MRLNNLDFYFGFEGRVSRQEFWVRFFLVAILAFVPVSAIFWITKPPQAAKVFIAVVVVLAILWTSIAVHVKRWHDINCSGWFVLLGLIPGIGVLANVVVCGFVRGTPGTNRFGEDPLPQDPESSAP